MRIPLVICFILSIALLGFNTTSAQSPSEIVTAQAQFVAATNDALNVRLLGQIGGLISTVYVTDNKAYIAEGRSVTILDVTHASAPAVLGRIQPLPELINAIIVQNHYLYVVVGSAGLHIFDVSDPANPLRVGFYDTPGTAQGVFVNGSYVYVADGDSGLRIVNVANPASASEVGFYDTPGFANNVYVAANYAYVADGDSGLRIVNVTNPLTPSQVGFYDTPGSARDVQIDGSYAYIGDLGSGLRIVNVANPAAPTEAGFYDASWVEDISVSGNYAYVADTDSGLSVVNVSNPATPVEVGFYGVRHVIEGVHVAGDYAYVADWDGRLWVVNVSNPATPTAASFYSTPKRADAVAVVGNYAYVANGSDGLHLLNIANPLVPSQVGFYDGSKFPSDVQVVGSYAYVTGYEDALRVVNVDNPAAPSEVGFTPAGGNGYQYLHVVGNYAYVVDAVGGAGSFSVMNVANPAAPVEVGTYDPPGNAGGVYVVGNYAYVATGDSGLRVVNVANPATPSEVGFLDTPGSAGGVYVVGNYAYVADGDSGLRVVNVANPATPSEVGFLDTPGSAWDVFVAGSYAYIADAAGGLRVINVAKPTAPFEVGFYVTPESASRVAVVGNTIYLTTGKGGLYLLRYPDCYYLSSKYGGMGAIPTANPANSPGCALNEYVPQAFITLSASPAPSWRVSSWLGTNNDNSTSANNTLTMPAADHTVTVSYAPICYVLTLTHSGSGNNPITTPANSQGCNAGQFAAGEVIALQATPAAGHGVSNWSGTTNDTSTANQNTLTMPARNHAASVAYIQVCHRLALTHTGSGTDPTATPAQSDDCPVQTYRADVAITLHASPGPGYTAGSWSGTSNNSSTALDNSLIMPSGDHTASVAYTLACFTLTLTHSGQGSDPIATPANSDGCASGRYHHTTVINVTASAAQGWQIASWIGTSNNSATTAVNSLTMPTDNHTVSANYSELPTAGPGDNYELDNSCTRSRPIAPDGSEVQEHTFHAVADADWIRFNATPGITYRIEVQILPDSSADVNLELYTECEGTLAGEWQESFSPGARLDFQTPVGGPVYVRLANQDANIAGNAVRYQISVRAMAAPNENRALIIVAGRLRGADTLQNNINNVAKNAYTVFHRNGFNDNQINFLATDSTLPGYDAAATRESLRAAIVTWAKTLLKPDGVLTLYMVDHGSADTFFLDELSGQRLNPTDLDQWLTELENGVAGIKINVIIEACQSGSFIAQPQSISKPNRVIITSANADNDAKASKDGAYFSDHLLTWLHQGYNLAVGFSEARTVAQKVFALQQAQIDADGNGVANEFGDSINAARRSFAYAGTLSSDDWPPYIFSVQAPPTITNFSGTLQADVRDNLNVHQVWAVVYPPDYVPPPTGQVLQAETLPTILLTRVDNGNIWQGVYTGFTQAGLYRIVIQADDNDALKARPVVLEVNIGNRVFLPLVVR